MSSDVDALVKDAIQAVKAGKKAEARLLLERATDADPENEKAWMWMSAVVEDPADQRICLENVLYINPDSTHAQKGLAILKEKHPEAFVEGAAPAEEEDTAPPQETAWDIPVTSTSSASSVFVPDDQPTPDVYDDWVAGLNLGGDEESEYDEDSGPLFNDLDFMGALEDDDDSASLRLDSMESGGAFTSDVFSSTDFETDVDEEDDLLSDFDMDDDVLSDDDLLGDPLLDDSDDLFDSFEMESPMSPGESLSGSAFAMDEYDDPGDEYDPGEYFRTIPDDIAPTRLPGTDESYPVLVILGLVVLVLLNIGAAGFLVMNLGA